MPVLHSSENLLSLRRSAAELLAFTVQELFPTVLLIGGNSTDIGFFYDFIFEQPLHDQALMLIEVRMKALIKENKEIRSLSMMRENAEHFFSHREQPILADKAAQKELNILSLMQIDEFYDLCAEIQETSTGQIGAIKLLEASKEQRLFSEDEGGEVTRIIGTAFPDLMALKKFLKAFDQLRKKDHRILGPELDLFSFSEQAGELDYFWHPKGECLRQILLQRWENYCHQQNAQFVKTPLVVKESFLKGENILPAFEFAGKQYALSQSRLLHYIQLFKRRSVSVYELPIRFAECAREYQKLDESLIWGLLRSYSYYMDHMITFCKEEQVTAELISSLHFIEEIVRIFDFKGHWYLIASKEKESKKKQDKRAIEWLNQVIKAYPLSNVVEVQDHLTLNKPRLEMRFVDSLGREWAGPSLEVISGGLNQLHVFYEEENNQQKCPVILKTCVFGSLDRFVALLIEQFEGALPMWLAPEQIRIMAIGSQNHAYAETVYKSCKQQGFRVNIDVRPEKLAARIHTAEKERIPYIILVGDKEREKKLVTVRAFQQRNVPHAISLESFFEKLQQ